MGTASTFSSPVQFKKANGVQTNHTGREHSGTKVETSTLARFSRTSHTVMVFTFIRMVRIMKVSGIRIPKKGRVRKSGKMANHIKVPTKMVLKMAMDFINGKMEVYSRGIGRITRFKAMEFIGGMMVVSMRGTLLIIICMERALINGLMEGFILGSLSRI